MRYPSVATISAGSETTAATSLGCSESESVSFYDLTAHSSARCILLIKIFASELHAVVFSIGKGRTRKQTPFKKIFSLLTTSSYSRNKIIRLKTAKIVVLQECKTALRQQRRNRYKRTKTGGFAVMRRGKTAFCRNAKEVAWQDQLSRSILPSTREKERRYCRISERTIFTVLAIGTPMIMPSTPYSLPPRTMAMITHKGCRLE